ncbi:MAG: hypothetical protein SPL08_04360 [Pseudomonadota bacterium]|nr:hypothetical protein [Pseudomonadota bacterium]
MRVKLVKIGNSTGIRLPKNVIRDCGFEAEVNLEVQNKTVILSSPKEGRATWADLFQESVRQKPIQDKGGEWEW